jgi:hypothetical protein
MAYPPVPPTEANPIKKAMKLKMKEGREAKGDRPPNLRTAETDGKKCATCTHFRVNGNRCRLHGEYRVQSGQVCDDWAPTK